MMEKMNSELEEKNEYIKKLEKILDMSKEGMEKIFKNEEMRNQMYESFKAFHNVFSHYGL